MIFSPGVHGGRHSYQLRRGPGQPDRAVGRMVQSVPCSPPWPGRVNPRREEITTCTGRASAHPREILPPPIPFSSGAARRHSVATSHGV